MQFDLAVNTLVLVKAPSTRLGKIGRVINQFAQTRTLYAVQFDDKCIGYFERSELEESTTEETATHKNKDKEFHDTTELETRP